MGYLIDSSVFIEYERGRIDLNEKVRGREEEEIFISVISVSELLHGVHRAKDRDMQARRSAFVEAVLSRFQILSIDAAVARLHARLWAEMKMEGTAIGLHDTWLAATCLAGGLTMVTGNLREFRRVAGLTVECWVANL